MSVKVNLLCVSGSEPHKAALRLLAISKLINQAVGDALSGLLLVEAILRHKNWSIHKWSELYQDLPSRQLKVCSSVSLLQVYYTIITFFRGKKQKLCSVFRAFF